MTDDNLLCAELIEQPIPHGFNRRLHLPVSRSNAPIG